MSVAVKSFEQLALDDPERSWEMHHGRLREKPGMSFGHNRTMVHLGYQLLHQLDLSTFDVRVNAGRVRRAEDTSYLPDVFIFPVELAEPFRDRWDILEVYDAPLPLVVEVWSPSTGDYDIDAKLPEYQRRGDTEIWRLHPFERTPRAWRRRPDGTYKESEQRGGTIEPMALPGVSIDLDALFG